jgi:hypothetical protein
MIEGMLHILLLGDNVYVITFSTTGNLACKPVHRRGWQEVEAFLKEARVRDDVLSEVTANMKRDGRTLIPRVLFPPDDLKRLGLV